MLRPLKKADAETRQVLNKSLKTEVHSPLCEFYIYIYIYIYIYSFRRLVKGPSNNALLSLDLEDHLCDLGVLNKFVDFYPVIQ